MSSPPLRGSSSTPPSPRGEAQAVYVEALAAEVDRAERERGIGIVSRRSRADGAGLWGVEDVTAPAPQRSTGPGQHSTFFWEPTTNGSGSNPADLLER
jgi:hypothetical protein